MENNFILRKFIVYSTYNPVTKYALKNEYIYPPETIIECWGQHHLQLPKASLQSKRPSTDEQTECDISHTMACYPINKGNDTYLCTV